MDTLSASPSFDWSGIRLAVFDVDGTLYNQRLLRSMMAFELLKQSVRSADLGVISLLRWYRTRRELIAEEELGDFESILIREASDYCGRSKAEVESIISDWLEQRPLKFLMRCRYHNIIEVFDNLRSSGIKIGIFSDYPASRKLQALCLNADFVVSSGDANVGYLKPNPRGLHVLMSAAFVTAKETVLIGDRVERDGVAALRAGSKSLILSKRPIDGWQTFSSYREDIFKRIPC